MYSRVRENINFIFVSIGYLSRDVKWVIGYQAIVWFSGKKSVVIKARQSTKNKTIYTLSRHDKHFFTYVLF